ncbi:LacI family transcriptional regulator [Microbacterium terrae]|uniref:HTH-type transcriptional regulator DegA n=1 Tax=Microbacterium terrae TaxID=69369 RepID=A0A0M2HFM1_9MICO|nr:LacI family DNA-binding transcriptional regulator [Microbacterium terrae]KJL43047.1 HTH-type transcriptional regulator DegA [Microbacterium terrae]MBP1079372.1 LacI family transcriptional regulator [Microbacterium terrae]GLJ98772.1 LacI family transcriptional regulator [Microbacterium terrae]
MSQSTPPARGAATLHDVAREAGVSLATASRVLNGSTRKVAESYREKVQAAADMLGYTANLSAQATARGTAAIVALLVADIADPYFGQLASGVARGADELGLVVTIAITERDPQREVRLVRALRGQRPRGLILAASRTDENDAAGLRDELDAFSATGGRVVALGRVAGDIRSVPVDNHVGAAALGADLATLGYRRAVVVAAAVGIRTSDDRVAGFTEGFTGGGGVIDEVVRGGFTRDAGYEIGTGILARGLDEGTLIFGVSDVVAIGIMSAIRDAGRQVGGDIAVAGFDDISTGRDIRPGLTTVRVPLEELGYRALHAVVDEDWDAAQPPLPLEVIVRGSTPPRI